MFRRKKHVELLLRGEEGKRHYVLIKDFTMFIYDHSLHREKKTFLPLFFTSSQCRRNIKMSY